MKCNNAPDYLPAIAFKVEKRVIQSPLGEIETVVPVFEADTVKIDLANVMNGEKKTRGPAPMAIPALARFLVSFLKGSWSPLCEIADEAGKAGLIGKRKPDPKTGKFGWSQFSNLYEAVREVPNLDGEHGGWTVVTSRDDPGLRGLDGRARWLLRGTNSSY